MSGNSDRIEWYLARDGQQHGPLSAVELDKFIELGHLKPTDLLWRAGFDDWRAAADVFPPTPAPPAPPAPPKEPKPAEKTAAVAQQNPANGNQQPNQQQKSLSDRVAAQSQFASENAAEARPVGPTRHQTHIQTNPDVTRPQHRPSAAHSADMSGAGMSGSGVAGGQPNVGDARVDTQPSLAAHSAVTQQPTRHSSPSQFSAPMTTAQPQPQQPRDAAMGQPAAPAEMRPAAVAIASKDFDDDAFLDDEEENGRSGWLMVAAALFILVIFGAGGLFAYNNQSAIAALYNDLAGERKTKSVAVVRAPENAAREPASRPKITALAKPDNAAPAPAVKPLPDLPILRSKLWEFAQSQFSDWAEQRVAVVREMSAQDKSLEEANKYLIASFVKFRRANAAVALMASPSNLEQVATAFVDSLQALTTKGPQTCYAFISAGESTPEVAPLYFEPQIGAKLEAQMLAILKAIADGKSTTKALRKRPSNEDYKKLQAELVKRGWTAADLNLISDPSALSKAKPEIVCRLVTEWFATQTTLGDQAARDQLIAESLGAVVGG